MVLQMKSKKRVSDFGEVYTGEREVNAIIDLVKIESMRIDSRFLEPACGNGNFMIKILERKLQVVRKTYKKSQDEYESYAFLAISSIYGIDILNDNVIECRERLYKFFNQQYSTLYKKKCSEDIRDSIIYLLSKNIILGDALTGLKDGEKAEPIIFSEWTMLKKIVKRRDYAMNDMIAYDELATDKNKIPKPRKEFQMINFKEVSNLG